MDFNVHKDQISVCETNLQGNAEYSVDCDITLPEYLPDIVRILRCTCTPGVTSHQINGDRISAECTCLVRVLYICEQGKVRCFEQTLNFSKQLELKTSDATCIYVGAKTDYVNYRVSGQRRFEVHGAVTVFAKANCKKPCEFIASAEGDGITIRQEKTEICNLICVCEKSFSVSETLDPSGITEPIGAIISSCATPIINEIKVISNKIFLKADLNIKTVLTLQDSCDIEIFESIIAINQIIEAPEITDDCVLDATLSLVNLDIRNRFDSAGNKNLLDASAVLDLSICGYKTRSVSAVKDAYSTKYECDIKKAIVYVPTLEEKIDDTFLCRGVCDLGTSGVAKVHSFICNDITSKFIIGDGVVNISGEITADIIYDDANGDTLFAQRQIPFEYSKPLQCDKDVISCQPVCSVSASSFMISDSNKLDARVEINVHGFVFGETEKSIATEITVDKTKCKKVKTASLTIYFADANESLWNIAEKYNTTVDAIIRENNISDGIIDKKCKLLIPRM